MQKNMERGTEILLDKARDKNIDLKSEKMSIVRRTHIAIEHRIQGESPAAFLKNYAVVE